MTTYSFRLIPLRGSKTNCVVQTVECETDAQALREACKVFGRDPDVDAIEVWDDRRKVVDLGGRDRLIPHH